jgi:hypothetical protein
MLGHRAMLEKQYSGNLALALSLIIAMFLFIVPEISRAQSSDIPSFYQASYLYSNCEHALNGVENRPHNGDKASACILWIDGFRSGFAAGSLFSHQEYFGCSSPDLPSRDFTRIFVYGMQKYPSLFSGDVFDAINKIFTAEFPC